MKKVLKSILCSVLVFMLLTSVFCINSFAAGTIISFSNNGSVAVGETLTVTVSLNAEEAMYGVGCVVTYDDGIFEYVSGASTGGGGSLQIIESPSGETKVTYHIAFKAKASGSCAFAVTDCRYESLSESKSLTGASASAKVTDASLSGNANLSKLSLSAGKLSPNFSANRTSYNVTVPNSVSDISVYATAADSSASVVAPSSTKLNIGKNTISVTVTAANGTQKTYTINVTRSETEIEEEPNTEEPAPSEDTNIVIDDVSYTIAEDISSVSMLTGFSATTTTYKDKEVTIASDKEGKFNIFYLKSPESEELVPYLYNAENDSFERLKYITRNEKTYIICEIPEDKTYPDSYFITNATVEEMEIRCLANALTSTDNFYYIYCFNGTEYGFYRFDTLENSFQRFPEITLSDIVVKDEKDEEKIDFSDRFAMLSGNAKIIIFASIILILCVIAIVVLIVLKTVNKNNYAFDDMLYDFEEEFDDIKVNKENSEQTVESETE